MGDRFYQQQLEARGTCPGYKGTNKRKRKMAWDDDKKAAVVEAYEKQDSKSFNEALPYLQKQIAECFKSKDAQEGIAAFLEKRKPNWD